MTAAAHTPGPWRLKSDPYEDGTPYFIIDAGEPYRDDDKGALKGFHTTAIMSPADAHLIIAAPDLLTALKALLSVVKASPTMQTREHIHLGMLVNAAIAKAEGLL